jgi:hypothetical protein
MNPMTEETKRIEQIEKRLAEATPGPCHYQEDSDAYTHIVRSASGEFLGSTPQGTLGKDEANARLWAAAPEDICFLLAQLKQSEARVVRMEGALRKIAYPEKPGNYVICECKHDDKDCCAVVDYHCPECIAGRVLVELAATHGAK